MRRRLTAVMLTNGGRLMSRFPWRHPISTVVGVVFVVDDDEAVRDSLRQFLEVCGYTVRDYATGVGFLAAIGRQDQGCLVLDCELNDMNALDVMETLRRRKIDLPTILVTDINNPSIAQNANRAGVRHILEKPWDCTHFLKLIDQMERARSH